MKDETKAGGWFLRALEIKLKTVGFAWLKQRE